MPFLRNLSLSLCPLLLLAGAQRASAQFSVYGTVGPSEYVFLNQNGNSVSGIVGSGGITGGGFYNFPIDSRLTAGIDLRTSYSPGTRGGNYTAAALRIGFVPDKVRLRPYFQIGGGVVSSIRPDYYPANQRYTSGGAEFLLGLDIRVTDSLDVRAPEYGAVAGGGNGISPAVAFLNLGVVYHLGHRRKP